MAKCYKCKYSLEGLPLDGECPECGYDLRASRRIARTGWSPEIGVRRALVASVIGVIAGAAVFGLVVALAHPVIAWSVGRGRGAFCALTALILLLPFRWLLWARLESALGAVGKLLGFWSCGMVILAIWIAGIALTNFGTAQPSIVSGVGFYLCLGMFIWTTFTVMTES